MKTIAAYCETMAMPLLLAYVLGVFTMEWYYAPRVAASTAAVAQASKVLARADVQMRLVIQACAPLLGWPVEATPELIPSAAPVGADEAAPRPAAVVTDGRKP